MTNEPPADDGEELVEDDLPGMDDTPEDSVIPDLRPPEEPGPDLPTWGEIFDNHGFDIHDRQAEVFGTPDGPNPDELPTPPDPPDPLNQPVEDSVIDELRFDLAKSVAGDIDPPMEPAAESFEPEADVSASDADLVEADLPTTSTGEFSQPDPAPTEPEPEQSFDEVVDDRIRQIGENLEAADRARYEEELQAAREQYGPDVDVEALVRHDRAQAAARQGASQSGVFSPPSWFTQYLTLILAGAGVVTAVIAAFVLFGGSDDAPAVSLPATEATSASSVAPTAAPTEVPALSEAPTITRALEDLAFAAAAASVDDVGDLWIELQLGAPLGVDPDTLAFVYAFAIGAAVQSDNGYNGIYYAITDSTSYAESIFGSADFPRTSREFNANFVIGQADLWMTDDGKLAIHMPGRTATGGLDASLFGADSMLLAGTIIWETDGAEPLDSIQELTLGTIATGGSYPLSSWVEIEPDLEPLTLTVPDTSNRN